MTTRATPERWVRLIDERSPGLTWLAATLLEWSALLPAERRSWHVTVSAKGGGSIQALTAFHAERGLLAVVSEPGANMPFFGLPDAVQRIVGDTAAVKELVDAVPDLAGQVTLSVQRTVHVAPAHLRAPDPGVRRAKEDEVAELERLVERSAGDPDPLAPGDLMAAALRGHLWVIVEGSTLLGMFRVEGASLRHVQIGDLIVPVTQRGKGNGTRLARAAAQIARDEYARDAVVASLESPAASKTLAAAGYLARGALEDVRLH